ncbi:putative pentatricopeptide repeat-containing protein At3g15200 [Zingiber officinale]|uniref:putative pentatricopeptide repeat-containing protein At3g15200 n=1 Tax=Zingiber officinale TaxID=94328 RepID=UPI001C4CC1C2|nr:putative pentatricopeptide repeat-containing protein At3g15200 [Zingiber officinale]XP_042462027.1 putative pentatricopeptide repeat-containing protein At3g15200 [Zingiber officinale]
MWVSKGRLLSFSATSTVLCQFSLANHDYVLKHKYASIAPSNSHCIKDSLVNKYSCFGPSSHFTKNNFCNASISYPVICSQELLCSSRRYYLGSPSESESISLPNRDGLASVDDSCASDAMAIQKILKSHDKSSGLSSALDECKIQLTEDLVVLVLRRNRSDWKLALSFFKWASTQTNYLHGPRAYNEILDILGRMKQVKLMQETFDEIPKDRQGSAINNKTFAILMHRYSGAHKVQEAIGIFYKRIDYGFELDLIGFQQLLMSLCRYKHVEEAEALFLQKQDQFPPVIKSRNIILNGWCVLGSLHDTTRFWNDINKSGCKPDLYTYSIFIKSLTKSGKLGTAVQLFTSMWEKGCDPDVTICNCIIDTLCFKKKVPQALEIFSEMTDRGCLLDVSTYNSLIKHLCKINRMQKVHELLNEMEEKGCNPNTRTYSYILKTADKPEEVTALLQRMERTSCKLDSDTYNLLLNLYMQWKHQKGSGSIWAEMKRSGLGPDQRSYTIMVHQLHSQGKLEEALQFYKEMRAKGMIPEPRTKLLINSIRLQKERRE